MNLENVSYEISPLFLKSFLTLSPLYCYAHDQTSRCITLHVCYFHHFHTLKNQKVDFINVKKMLYQSFYPSAGRILFITAMNGFPFSQKLSWGMASLYHFLVVHSRSYCFSGTGTHRLYYLVEKRCFFTHVVKNKCIH